MGCYSKTERVNSLVDYFGKGNKSEFARILGTTPQVVATWIARDTINYDLVYTKCEGVNPHWLLTGEGAMLNNNEAPPTTTNDNTAIIQLATTIQELTSNLNDCNKEIGELRERVGSAEARAELLQAELNRKVKYAGDVNSEESALAG